MTQAKIDLGFDVDSPREGVTRISGRGVGLGVKGFIVMGLLSAFIGYPVGALIALLTFGEGVMTFLLGMVATVGMVFLFNKWKSRPFEFELSNSGLTLDETTYAHENISEVFIDNGHQKGQAIVSGGGFAVGGFGLSGISLAGTMAVANSGSAALINTAMSAGSAVNYRLNIRHGRKTVTLAKHLDEDTAMSLFHFITEQ